MAIGLPIVTTPVYGIREQVREHENALFFEPGNIAELIDRITHLVTDPQLRQTLAENAGHTLACLTTFEEMVAAYEHALKSAAVSSIPPAGFGRPIRRVGPMAHERERML
jgi:glycosyltransferase involved in cell wall biosynthesis